jgi:hypothetical protein
MKNNQASYETVSGSRKHSIKMMALYSFAIIWIYLAFSYSSSITSPSLINNKAGNIFFILNYFDESKLNVTKSNDLKKELNFATHLLISTKASLSNFSNYEKGGDQDKFAKIHDNNMKCILSILEYQNDNTSLLNCCSAVFSLSVRPGYANRMYGVLTAFTAAIITKSAIMIDWPQIDKYIEPKSFIHKNSIVLLNSNFSVSTFKKLEDLYINRKSNNKNMLNLSIEKFKLPMGTPNTWKYEKKFADLAKTYLPGSFDSCKSSEYCTNSSRRKIKYYVVQSNAAYFFELCSNQLYSEKIRKHLNISDHESTRTKRRETLTVENEEMIKLENALTFGFRVAHKIIKRYWRPRQFIYDTLRSFILKHDFANSYIIGIQLRFQMLQVNSVANNDLLKFLKCIEKIESNYNGTNEGKIIKWFITGDSLVHLNYLKKMYGEKIILVDSEVKLGHTTYDDNAYFRTILDLELLGSCDELIVTGGSSYGMMASIMNGKLPYFVNGGGRMHQSDNKSFVCERMKLSRPSVNKDGTASFK